jgi:hypothetical protein
LERNWDLSRLLKNAHLLRFSHPSSLRRTAKYASLLRISRALHLGIFNQPEKKSLFRQRVSDFINPDTQKLSKKGENGDG